MNPRSGLAWAGVFALHVKRILVVWGNLEGVERQSRAKAQRAQRAQRKTINIGSKDCKLLNFLASFAPLREEKLFGLVSEGELMQRENEIATIIVDAAFHVHRTLGPGLLESAYVAIMMHELHKRGLTVETQVSVPVVYESIRLDAGFRADLIVEDSVIVELKSLEKIAPVHKKQLTTYLRLAGKRLGLLINFGDELIKDGITRVVNGMPD